jgi:NTE family protein
MAYDSKVDGTEERRADVSAYGEIALVLQGGGALGSYQAGVFQGLAEAGVEPSWIAGISIGALNTAIIAGNAPENRLAALKGFWEAISRPEDHFGLAGSMMLKSMGLDAAARRLSSGWSALRTILEGQGEFFLPARQLPFAALDRKAPSEVSYYDTTPLLATLERFADFGRINNGDIRVSVGAVNVRDGNFSYFDNREIKLEPKHFMASGALPPAFPAVEIDGEYYWDGGIVSNTPLIEVLREAREKDVLVFQVDLWSARGRLPGDHADVEERVKDIRFSSKTRAITDMMGERRRRAHVVQELLSLIPADTRANSDVLERARAIATLGTVNIFHLIYQNKSFEGYYKDAEFSHATMVEHWASGLKDMQDSLRHRSWLDIPCRETGFVTHDVHRHR